MQNKISIHLCAYVVCRQRKAVPHTHTVWSVFFVGLIYAIAAPHTLNIPDILTRYGCSLFHYMQCIIFSTKNAIVYIPFTRWIIFVLFYSWLVRSIVVDIFPLTHTNIIHSKCSFTVLFSFSVCFLFLYLRRVYICVVSHFMVMTPCHTILILAIITTENEDGTKQNSISTLL